MIWFVDLWFFDIDFNCNGDREAKWFDPFSDQIFLWERRSSWSLEVWIRMIYQTNVQSGLVFILHILFVFFLVKGRQKGLFLLFQSDSDFFINYFSLIPYRHGFASLKNSQTNSIKIQPISFLFIRNAIMMPVFSSMKNAV